MKKIIIPVIAVVLVGAALTVYLQDLPQEIQSDEDLTSGTQLNTNDISWQQAAAQSLTMCRNLLRKSCRVLPAMDWIAAIHMSYPRIGAIIGGSPSGLCLV